MPPETLLQRELPPLFGAEKSAAIVARITFQSGLRRTTRRITFGFIASTSTRGSGLCADDGVLIVVPVLTAHLW